MEIDLFSIYEFLSEANETCVKMCYNPNSYNILTSAKEDGLVEVYGCQYNCMKKMDTALNLFKQYSQTHPRYVARNKQLKAIREEEEKAVFYYGSQDHQNFQI